MIKEQPSEGIPLICPAQIPMANPGSTENPPHSSSGGLSPHSLAPGHTALRQPSPRGTAGVPPSMASGMCELGLCHLTSLPFCSLVCKMGIVQASPATMKVKVL